MMELIKIIALATVTGEPDHRGGYGGFRKFGVMPTTWAGGHGSGAAPIKPLVEALEKSDE